MKSLISQIKFKHLNHFILFTVVVCLSFFYFSCNQNPDYSEPDSVILAQVNDINSDSLESYVQWIQNMQSRFFLHENHRNIAFQIRNRFIQFGFTNVQVDSFKLDVEIDGTNYTTWQYNVIATINGKTTPDSIYLLGAHYDAVNDNTDAFIECPGADDNGSGIASMFEIARNMMNSSYSPKSTIQFVAFAAEENNLDGSTHFAEEASNSGKKIAIMLNLDMIGYAEGNAPNEWFINIMSYKNSKELLDQSFRICSQYTDIQCSNNNKYNKEGDSYSFYNYGYKAIFFNSDIENPYYHTENDLIEYCNFDFIKEVTKIPFAILLMLN